MYYKRLNTILSLVEGNARGVIDVGTDHGYIPISLAMNGFSGNIIASDINEMPLSAAELSAHDAGVSDRIHFRLGNGLECCSADEVDTIIIAGLGGDMIASIIDSADWTMDDRIRLILQPMTKAEVLRFYLSCNGYKIISENPVFENGKLFHIIHSGFTGENEYLSDGELFTGRSELIVSDPLYDDILSAESEKIGKAVNGMRLSSPGSVQERFFSGILQKLNDMKDRNHDLC